MIISSLMLAAMLQSPLAQVDTSRAAFTKCLREEVKKSLEAKMSPADFTASLPKKCGPSRATFRAALIAADESSATAAEDADAQVEDYHANFADKFSDYSESNSMPAD